MKVAVDLLAAFIRSSERHPHRIAARTPSGSVTYAELRRRSMSLAATLDRRAPADPPLTCSLGGRTPTAYAGILAALYRGHGYLPLSTSHPAARNAEVLSRTGCAAIVADELGARQLIELVGRLEQRPTLVVPDLVDPTELREHASGCAVIGGDELESGEAAVDRETEAASLAYLLFTSGSTGTPKGVMVSHDNVTSFVSSILARYDFSEGDVFLQSSELTFDLSVFPVWVAWAVGGCVLWPSATQMIKPGSTLRREGVTVSLVVPSVGRVMLKLGDLEPGSLPSLRYALFCGEALPVEVARGWSRAAPGATIENLYGPTEATVACTAHTWRPEDDEEEEAGVVPIGRPFPGMDCLVVDASLREVPSGEVGELIVAGPQVALGYFQDPERTAACFPVPPGRSERFYRTGDLVRRTSAQGPLVYVGRSDHQVKIRGHRVELGEIEAALRRASASSIRAVALPWPRTASGADGVVAFVEAEGVVASVLRRALRDHLPDYMIPTEIRFLPGFPSTPNGKVDRRRLEQLLEEAHGNPQLC